MKTKILAGLLAAAALAIVPGVALARGGGGGGGSHGGGGGGSHGGGGGGSHGGGSFHGGSSFHGGDFHGGGFHDGSFHGRGDFHGGFTHHGFETDGVRFRHDHDRFFSHSLAFGVPWPGYYDPNYFGSYGYGYPYANYTASDYSNVILAVQRALAQLGYYDGPLDGVVGLQTKKAIRWFQSVDRLPATGEIDPPTLRALRIG